MTTPRVNWAVLRYYWKYQRGWLLGWPIFWLTYIGVVVYTVIESIKGAHP